MRGKGLKKWGWIGIAICLFLPASGYAKNDIVMPNHYPMEAIVARPEMLENELILIKGYAKFEKEGVILYYTDRDYRYDTKENAVWLPERKELPIEKYFQNRLIDKREEGCVDGCFYTAVGVVQQKETGCPYAAVALYCEDNDEIWNMAKALPKTIEKYDRKNEEKKAERISYYRLLGDPWSFDGRKVCVDIQYKQEAELWLNGAEYRYFGIQCTEDIYGDTIDYQKPVQEIVDKYKKKEKFKDVEIEKLRDIVEIPIYANGIRMEMEMMFYMYEVSKYRPEKTVVNYTCWPCIIRVVDKDKEKWEKGVEELYQAYLNK